MTNRSLEQVAKVMRWVAVLAVLGFLASLVTLDLWERPSSGFVPLTVSLSLLLAPLLFFGATSLREEGRCAFCGEGPCRLAPRRGLAPDLCCPCARDYERERAEHDVT